MMGCDNIFVRTSSEGLEVEKTSLKDNEHIKQNERVPCSNPSIKCYKTCFYRVIYM